MTEVATTTYTPTGLTVPAQPAPIMDYQTRAVTRLAEWVHAADAAYTVATRLVESSFVPAQFRGKPVEATAAILAGSEVGLSPMAALRAFDVIQGQAAPRAITLRAIVQSYGHEIVLRESTATRCIMAGRRKGTTEWQQSVWTMERAQGLALTSKDNWKKQPGAMLVARATSEIARLIAADAILGIGYTAEEIADGATGDPGTPTTDATPETAPEQPTTRRMSRTRKTEPEPTAPTDGPITDHTRARMFALLSEQGITDAEDQRAGMTNIIGRTVESRSSLTEGEGLTIVTYLIRRAEDAAERNGGEVPMGGEQ